MGGISEEPLARIRQAIESKQYRFSSHADEEAQAENVTLAEIREALLTGQILEDYPEHRRGPCCLVYGQTGDARDLHIVISTGQFPLTIVTVYEPVPPYWVTPTERGTGQ